MTRADQPSSGIEPGANAVAPTVLDVDDGIERVMGDHALYARILRRFRDDYQHGMLPIRNAIASGDGLLAHRIVHTLRGASGMISAPALHQQTGVLESGLRNALSGQAGAIASLERALSEVLLAIESVLKGEPAAGAASLAPSPAIVPDQALVAQLAELLAGGDGAAVDLLEQSGASLKAILGEAGFSQVTTAANEFDFDRALEALRRFVGRE